MYSFSQFSLEFRAYVYNASLFRCDIGIGVLASRSMQSPEDIPFANIVMVMSNGSLCPAYASLVHSENKARDRCELETVFSESAVTGVYTLSHCLLRHRSCSQSPACLAVFDKNLTEVNGLLEKYTTSDAERFSDQDKNAFLAHKIHLIVGRGKSPRQQHNLKYAAAAELGLMKKKLSL